MKRTSLYIGVLTALMVFIVSPRVVVAQQVEDIKADIEKAFITAAQEQQRSTNADFLLQPIETLYNATVNGGAVIAGAADVATQPLQTRPDIIFVQREGSEWRFYFPGNPHYGVVRGSFLPDFREQLDDTYGSLTRDETLSVPQQHTIPYYRLPWLHETGATVTRSYASHGNGEIDFDVDEVPITAAADGTIVYINDSNTRNTWDTGEWWLWNVVVIRHADSAYVTYAHLQYDSVPQWIKSRCTTDYNSQNCSVAINAGQIIGYEGNTGMSTAPHLHMAIGATLVVDSRYPTAYAWNLYDAGFQAFGTYYDASMVRNWGYGTRLTADNFYPTTTWDFRQPKQTWTIIAQTLRDDGVDTQYRGRQYAVLHPYSQLVSDWLSIDADRYHYLYLRMSTQTVGCARLLFQRAADTYMSSTRRVELSLNVDTNTHAYLLDMQQHPLWAGEIIRLRLDPACGMGGANTLRLDTLQLLTESDVRAMTDVNRDGIVSPRDAVYVANRVGTGAMGADANNDGRIDSADVTLIGQLMGK